MSGRASKQKGATGEREVIVILQPVVNQVYAAHGLDPPKLERNAMQSARGGEDIEGLPWLSVEVKRCETLKVTQWWQQTLASAGTHKEPVLMYRQNGGIANWRIRMWGRVGAYTVPVTIDLDAFLLWFRGRLAEELNEEG